MPADAPPAVPLSDSPPLALPTPAEAMAAARWHEGPRASQLRRLHKLLLAMADVAGDLAEPEGDANG